MWQEGRREVRGQLIPSGFPGQSKEFGFLLKQQRYFILFCHWNSFSPSSYVRLGFLLSVLWFEFLIFSL
jgi:hypothetical protein